MSILAKPVVLLSVTAAVVLGFLGSFYHVPADGVLALSTVGVLSAYACDMLNDALS